MARTDVNIVNIALARLGITDVITTLTETTNDQAIQANLIYAETRDALMREFPWRFATKHVSLNETLYDIEQTEFDHHYDYPDDCLRVLRVYDVTTERSTITPKTQYEVYSVGTATDDSVRVIATNLERASADYIARITDPDFFDSTFVDCLAWRLAAELAVPLTRGFDKRDELYKIYISTLEAARAIDMSEGHKRIVTRRSKYVGAR